MRPLASLCRKDRLKLIDAAQDFDAMDYEMVMDAFKTVRKRPVLELFVESMDFAQLLETERLLQRKGKGDEWLDVLLTVRRRRPDLYRRYTANLSVI